MQPGYFDRQFEITQKKSQSSVVTEVDIESERVIIEVIRSGFPGHNIVSEECGLVNNGLEVGGVMKGIDGGDIRYSVDEGVTGRSYAMVTGVKEIVGEVAVVG